MAKVVGAVEVLPRRLLRDDVGMIPPVWRALIEDLNGIQETRDPSSPCEAWDYVEEPTGLGDCMTDGHYRCVECKHIALSALRAKRDQCRECGTKVVFVNSSHGECPKSCEPWEPRW